MPLLAALFADTVPLQAASQPETKQFSINLSGVGRTVYPGSVEQPVPATARAAKPDDPVQSFYVRLKEPTEANYKLVGDWFTAQGLKVRRLGKTLPLSVSGTVARVSRALRVEIAETFSAGKLVRWARTAASLPGDIARYVEAIWGLQPVSKTAGECQAGSSFSLGPNNFAKCSPPAPEQPPFNRALPCRPGPFMDCAPSTPAGQP
ncbi:protease pro-enzyme activation domain-containing protein [Gloeobacter violaceus]|uniref:protease pro-enzyme activation domain-containing protein n=1 Tax=Gloeobacter violaceus TaxID=33072 RepID=UPI0013E8C2D0|nr:protease pro-enzyme activation domain-containing protein [Gloeobacter violaceus]